MTTAHDERHAERLRLLTETGPGTEMGRLLRRFWHPVAIAADLAVGAAQSIRILSEDLTLYRGDSGNAFLIGGRCAHRCTVLHTGWVQGDEVRCMYHGWKYDGTGRCTEMPAERHPSPGAVSIAGYPVHEYSGLIFAYLGEGPAPEFLLPRNEALEKPGFDVSNRRDVWDCNWLQLAENSLDGTHLAFVHRWPNPTRLGEELGAAIPELHYDETSGGIRQTTIRPTGVRISNWTFPNNNHVLAAPPRPGDPWVNSVSWGVPIDDEHTLRIACFSYPGGEVGEDLVRNGAIPGGGTLAHSATLFNEHRLPDLPAADRIMAQDYAAARGQGTIHDRSKERLGSSDAGIALLRRIFFRELEALQTGQPTKQWVKNRETDLQRLTSAP